MPSENIVGCYSTAGLVNYAKIRQINIKKTKSKEVRLI